MQVNAMNLKILRTKYKKDILEIAAICNAESIKVFGSVVRGENNKDSDIDFLVHMKPNTGFSIGGIGWRLEKLLGRKVDVVPDTSLHWSLKDQILKEAVLL
jgi:predicted nucleotidyltransferase